MFNNFLKVSSRIVDNISGGNMLGPYWIDTVVCVYIRLAYLIDFGWFSLSWGYFSLYKTTNNEVEFPLIMAFPFRYHFWNVPAIVISCYKFCDIEENTHLCVVLSPALVSRKVKGLSLTLWNMYREL